MTLKQKLIGMTAGIVLLLAIINYLQFERVLGDQRTKAVSEMENLSEILMIVLGAQFYEHYKSIQTLAQNDALRQENPNEAHLTSVFNEYARIQGIYDTVLLVNADGGFVASNDMSVEGRHLHTSRLRSRNYSNTPWFRAAINGTFSEEPKKNLAGTFIEDAQIDPISSSLYGENRLGNAFTTVVKNQKGKVTGVLTTRANFRWVESEFKMFYDSMVDRGFATTSIDLLNKSGYYLASFDPKHHGKDAQVERDLDNTVLKQNITSTFLPYAQLVSGKSGSQTAFHPGKQKVRAVGYTHTSSVPRLPTSLGWGLAVGLDETEVFTMTTTARNQFLWLCLAVMGVFVMVAYWFAGRIGRTLARLSANISETSAQVMAGSEQMSSASQSLASTATQAASSLEETVSSIEQLAAMVKRNSDHSSEAANLSRASRESADVGEFEIKKLVEAMNDINHSSKKIEDIINVIDDIAFQTNLLALNAAVEAARAGDQGKGFAVVAEEVRNLAQRSAAAAKDITALIKENVSKIEGGVQVAGRGGDALRTIVSSVRKVADLNSEIASASKEQAHGLEQISQAMAQLDQVTQTNAASAEEVASSSEEMSSQGLMMQSTVAQLNRLIHGTRIHRSINREMTPRSGFGSGNSGGGPGANVIPMRNKHAAAEKVIPFDSNDDDNGNLGSTSGF